MLSAMPEDAVAQAAPDAVQRTGTWLQRDVKRAINAAETAGLGHYRIEIAPDGTICIVVGEAPAA